LGLWEYFGFYSLYFGSRRGVSPEPVDLSEAQVARRGLGGFRLLASGLTPEASQRLILEGRKQSMATDQVKRFSMNLDDYIAGGLVGDIDVEILEAVATLEKPPNYTADSAFIKLTLKNLEDGAEFSNWWSFGSPESWAPSDDGNFMLAVGRASAPSRSSNWYAMHQSLVNNCGMPKDKLASGLSVLVGAKIHVVRAKAPDRAGLDQQRAEGARGPADILIAAKVISWPWEKGAKGGKTAARPAAATTAAKPTAAAAGAAGGDIDAKATEWVRKALEANGGLVELARVKPVVFSAIGTSEPATVRQQIVARLSKAWLGENGFTVDSGTVQVAE
jgi:hypothetical protein